MINKNTTIFFLHSMGNNVSANKTNQTIVTNPISANANDFEKSLKKSEIEFINNNSEEQTNNTIPLWDIFFEDHNVSKKEHNNNLHAMATLKINDIQQIVEKTYQIDESLDDISKNCHQILKTKKAYKITNINESHHHFHYKTGLNVLQSDFNTKDECSYGGLYFSTENDILNWLEYGVYYREVFVCPDSKIIQYGTKFKTDKFILGKRKLINLQFIERNKKYNKKNIPISRIFTIINNILLSNEFNKSQIENIFNFNICHALLFFDDNYQFKNDVHLYVLDQISTIQNIRKIYKIYSHMINPSDEVINKAIEICPYIVTQIQNPTESMINILMDSESVNKTYFKEIVCDDKTYDVMFEYFEKQGRLYDIAYLKRINNTNQQYLVEKNKKNIILISDPSVETLEKCNGVEKLQCYYDMYNCSNHIHKLSLETIINNDINTRLKESLIAKFGESNDILKLLEKFNGYISGSFATNIIYNTDFNCSDIDIYFSSYSEALEFGNELVKYEYLRTNVVTYSAYSILGVHIDKIITHRILNPSKKHMIQKIQLIVINRKLNLVNYIMTYFDIDYCKVAIGGTDGDIYTYKQILPTVDSLVDIGCVSNHIYNVLELINDNLSEQQKLYEIGNHYFNCLGDYQETIPDCKLKYYKSLISSTDFYINKVRKRVRKYKSRSVMFNKEKYNDFKKKLKETEKNMIDHRISLCLYNSQRNKFMRFVGDRIKKIE